MGGGGVSTRVLPRGSVGPVCASLSSVASSYPPSFRRAPASTALFHHCGHARAHRNATSQRRRPSLRLCDPDPPGSPAPTNRRLAAVSSRALPAAAAASAAAAGPPPCRSCAVALLPPRLTCVAGGAVSHRLVLSPASSRLALLLPPPACKFASACKLQGVFCVVDCRPSSCVAATPSACAALPTLPDSRSPRWCCSRASPRCRRLPLSPSRGVSASSPSLLCTGAPA